MTCAKCQYNECNRSFKASKELKRHINEVHKNLKPFECNRKNCDQKFSRNSILNEHIKRHLNIKQFKCQYNECDRSFVTSYELKNHINSVHKKEKPFKCYTNLFT